MQDFQSYYGKLKFPSGDWVLGCHLRSCKISISIAYFPNILSLKSLGVLFEANWSTIILLVTCFFLACGEMNFSRNILLLKNIPNIMSWIVDVLCCRR